jgi:hypothetical protein
LVHNSCQPPSQSAFPKFFKGIAITPVKPNHKFVLQSVRILPAVPKCHKTSPLNPTQQPKTASPQILAPFSHSTVGAKGLLREIAEG